MLSFLLLHRQHIVSGTLTFLAPSEGLLTGGLYLVRKYPSQESHPTSRFKNRRFLTRITVLPARRVVDTFRHATRSGTCLTRLGVFPGAPNASRTSAVRRMGKAVIDKRHARLSKLAGGR